MTTTRPPSRAAWLYPLALATALLLAACSSKPPAKQWQVRSQAALELAERAYLDGDERVAALELQRARAQVARTGDPAELALLELRQCAVQTASLDWAECSAFTPLAAASSAQARAYAAYLAGQALQPQERALLPQTQQAAAALTHADAQALATLRAVEDPLSRLLATALLARRSGAMPPELMTLAIDTASEQGWRRPLLAWLLRQQNHAEQHGLTELAEQTRLRLQVLEKAD